MRILLAIIAGLLCGIAGMRRATLLRRNAQLLRRWDALLRHLSLLLHQGGESLPQTLEAAATVDAPPDQLLRSLAQALRNAPLVPLEEHFARLCADSPARDALLRMARCLGRGELVSRCQAVDQAAEEIALLATQAQASADKDARMWTTLGWLGGACLILMLL